MSQHQTAIVIYPAIVIVDVTARLVCNGFAVAVALVEVVVAEDRPKVCAIHTGMTHSKCLASCIAIFVWKNVSDKLLVLEMVVFKERTLFNCIIRAKSYEAKIAFGLLMVEMAVIYFHGFAI